MMQAAAPCIVARMCLSLHLRLVVDRRKLIVTAYDRLFWVVAIVTAVACSTACNIDVPDGLFACAAEKSCPGGFVCRDLGASGKRCVRSDASFIDAGTPDAGHSPDAGKPDAGQPLDARAPDTGSVIIFPDSGTDAANPVDAGPSPTLSECKSGEARCSQLNFERCSTTEHWEVVTPCQYACDDTKGCLGECEPNGMPRCKDDGSRTQHCSDARVWVDVDKCEFGCNANTSICLKCKPQAQTCDGQQPRRCRDDGDGFIDNGVACTSLCKDGSCTACKSGEPPRCDGDGVSSCGSDGMWEPPVACGAATPTCFAGACAVCQPGTMRCIETLPEVCASDGSAWMNGTITPGVCGAECNPNTDECKDPLYRVCQPTGKWGSFAVVLPHCGAVCSPNATSDCGTALRALGACASGTSQCNGAGQWGSCSITPSPDSCDCNNDNNCNGSAHDGCSCCNGQTQACTTSQGCSGMQTCTNGSWGGCGGGPTLRCPDGWTDRGADCELSGGTNGSVMPQNDNQWTYSIDVPAGAQVSSSYVRIDYYSGGCYCTNTADAVHVSCNDGWGKDFTQVESGCNDSTVGSVNWQTASSCTLSRIAGWTPFTQGTCAKYGNLNVWFKMPKSCR
jgi:hypothetical protein